MTDRQIHGGLRWPAAVGAAVVYVVAIAAANYATARSGFIPVGFGLVATAGTYCAGASLVLRDLVQDLAGRRWTAALIVAGAGLSAVLAGPRLAVASGVAFLVAETFDLAVYTPLRGKGWARAVTASQIVGAVVDTFAFLWLAGFPISPPSVAGQLVGKAWALAPVALVAVWFWSRRRVVPSHPKHPHGA